MNDWFILSDVAEGIPVDSQQLVNLVCCTQLFLRELRKCHCLVESNPMEMTAFYGKAFNDKSISQIMSYFINLLYIILY